ncbi:MAG: hypothetical protein D6702_11950 [Planctomycetota bacterium]|nr:MAG: hypothetical protein D6702_11950 [Planctomycetota bacterium]
MARPAGLLLLFLAVPWILRSRRRRPRPWVVGGLEPFRELTARAPRRRGWPLSLWLGLSALVAASLAAAGPVRPCFAPLWILDRSPSCVGDPALAGPAFQPPPAAETIRIRGGEHGLTAGELLETVRLEGAGRWVVVVTDLPAPAGLPEAVEWRRLPRSGRNAALLDVWRDGEGGLQVRWGNWTGRSIRLEAPGAELPLTGEEGVARIPEPPPGTILRLAADDGRPLGDDQPVDDLWTVRPAPVVRLPESADPRWEDALRAAWPGCRPRRGAAAAAEEPVLAVRFGGEGPLAFTEDPFRVLPEIEAVAEVAGRLERARRSWVGTRPWRECAPAPATPAWEGPAPQPARLDASWPLAAAGLGLYLLSLLFRRLGH